jgi:hypothetical protein
MLLTFVHYETELDIVTDTGETIFFGRFIPELLFNEEIDKYNVLDIKVLPFTEWEVDHLNLAEQIQTLEITVTG